MFNKLTDYDSVTYVLFLEANKLEHGLKMIEKHGLNERLNNNHNDESIVTSIELCNTVIRFYDALGK